MTENNETTKTEEIRKEDPTVKVDSMANVVQDLIKTKDSLIVEKSSQIDELQKKIAELEKTVNANPVDKGTEQAQALKATDADDVGTKADAKNDVAPKPSEAQASIIAPAVKEPGKDEASVTMENKADDSEKPEKTDKDPKHEMAKDDDEKKDEKKMEEVKKIDSIYKVVDTVRPLIKSSVAQDSVPTAYQMLKACEQGFGETKDANQALVIMHQKMQKGEFGDGTVTGVMG